MRNSLHPQDYQQKLHQTVVQYDGFPVYVTVHSTTAFEVAGLHKSSSFKKRQIHPDDPKLDVSTPPCGYFNHGNSDDGHYAYYIERHPVRRWQQGLTSSNTGITSLTTTGLSNRASRDLLYSKGYEDLVLGNYPSFEECLKILKSPNTFSIAVNKDVAIVKRDSIYVVFYKKSEVGWMKPDSTKLKIPKEPDTIIMSKFLSQLPWEIE